MRFQVSTESINQSIRKIFNVSRITNVIARSTDDDRVDAAVTVGGRLFQKVQCYIVHKLQRSR